MSPLPDGAGQALTSDQQAAASIAANIGKVMTKRDEAARMEAEEKGELPDSTEKQVEVGDTPEDLPSKQMEKLAEEAEQAKNKEPLQATQFSGGGKTLDITQTSQLKNVKQYGNSETWQHICKASNENEGWMKSTKAMELPGIGCVVQVTTQQRNQNGSYSIAEALAFVPGAVIRGDARTGRKLVKA